jgi:hypothetical protein
MGGTSASAAASRTRTVTSRPATTQMTAKHAQTIA